MRYRKKPVEIHAFRHDGSIEALTAFLEETNEQRADDGESILVASPGQHVTVRTLEGDMRCEIGDWLICGVAGELYPCKPDIFDATYEPVITFDVEHLVVTTRAELDDAYEDGWELDHDECGHTDRLEVCDGIGGDRSCSLGPVRWYFTRPISLDSGDTP